MTILRVALALGMLTLTACSGTPSGKKAGAGSTSGPTVETPKEDEDPFYGVYWGMEATTSVYLTAFTLLETNEYLGGVVSTGPLSTAEGCSAEAVQALRAKRSVPCVPFTLEDDKLVVQFSGSERTWLREADGSLRPKNSGDTTIWSFRRAWRPTFNRLEGRFRRYAGTTVEDGVGGSTSTSSSSVLEMHEDGSFRGSISSGVFSSTGAAGSSSRSVEGTYAIDGFDAHLTLSSGEEATVRFLSLSEERGDPAPRFLYVEGFGFLRRDE